MTTIPTYRLPESLRSELKSPLAPVRDTAGALAAARGFAPLVSVGDVVTGMFLDAGRVPDVMVIDLKTKRVHDVHLEGRVKATGARVVPVSNPQAEITADLWHALEAELHARGGPGGSARDRPATAVVILVRGEEDLAVLPALALAPLGGAVVYGQPDEGAVVVPVTEESRERALGLLKRMEVS